MKPLKILTRSSRLALWQANSIREALEDLGERVELIEVNSKGDQDRVTPLNRFGATGLFTKALQERLLDGQGDLAVHSLKDLPSQTIPGLSLVAVRGEAPVEDVLVSRHSGGLRGLPEGARVGSSSPRRRAFLGALRPDLVWEDLRGNVPTRLKKVLETGELDATILAAAGLERLGLLRPDFERLDPSLVVPAACQGLLGIECLESSPHLEVLAQLDRPLARLRAQAERSFNRSFGASCQSPLGVHARIDEVESTLRVAFRSPEGRILRLQKDLGPHSSLSASDWIEAATALAAQLRGELALPSASERISP